MDANFSSNTTLCSQQQRQPTSVEAILKLSVYIIAFVLALLGNSLVMHIVFRKTSFRTTTNFFIVNNAFSDFVLAVLCMPSSMYAIATNTSQSFLKGWLGALLCKLQPFLQGLFVAVSVSTVSVLAGDRFLAIVYPFQKIICKRRAKIIILVLYIVGVLFNTPVLYAMTYSEQNGQSSCMEIWEPYLDSKKASKDFTIVMFVFVYLLPLTAVTIFYSAVIRELWRGKVHHVNTVAFRENKSVLKMVLTVTIVFAICWLPVHVIVFITYFTTDAFFIMCSVDPAFVFIGWFLAHVNTAINPIIYFIYAENFRAEAIKSIRSVVRVLSRKRRAIRENVPGRFTTPMPEEISRSSSVYYSIRRSTQTEQSTAQLCPE